MTAKNKQTFGMPDYQTTTDDQDEYIAAWNDLAAPIEKALGLTLNGFDPTFSFRKGNPNGVSSTVELPVWFVRDLYVVLSKHNTFIHTIADATRNHSVIDDNACVMANVLGDALETIDPEWWKK